MTEQAIKPEKITKPIQLLGAWLAGLFSIDTAFLLTAAKLPDHSWEASTLIVAAIVNVPLFLAAVFLLQTKFRPELQEDSYYSTYLSQRTNEEIVVTKDEQRFIRLQEQLAVALESKRAPPQQLGNDDPFLGLTFGINKHFADRKEIVAGLASVGVIDYTLFGGDEPPSERVVSISQHISTNKLGELRKLIRSLGFTRYNFFDNIAEEAEEDVLIGSYGPGERFLAQEAI